MRVVEEERDDDDDDDDDAFDSLHPARAPATTVAEESPGDAKRSSARGADSPDSDSVVDVLDGVKGLRGSAAPAPIIGGGGGIDARVADDDTAVSKEAAKKPAKRPADPRRIPIAEPPPRRHPRLAPRAAGGDDDRDIFEPIDAEEATGTDARSAPDVEKAAEDEDEEEKTRKRRGE